MTETFEQMALRTWQEVCKSLSVGAPVAIKFAAAIRDELAKGAEPVAWMNSRNGFIAKENKNPEYNVGLYACPPSAAARIAELEQESDELRRKIADIKRPDFREMREMLRAMQAGELTVSRGIEILEIWSAGNWNDSMLPPVRQDLVEEDSMPVEIIDRLSVENAELRQQVISSDAQALDHWHELAASQAREKQLRDELFAVLAQDMPDFKARLKVAAITTDTTALQSMIAKAGEVMRKRALVPCDDLSENDGNSTECRAAAGLCGIAIDALPAITLDDLKGGAA